MLTWYLQLKTSENIHSKHSFHIYQNSVGDINADKSTVNFSFKAGMKRKLG